MRMRFQFTLRTFLVAQLIALVLLGWFADHYYQQRAYMALHKRAAQCLMNVKLRESIVAIQTEKDKEKYEEAMINGLGAIQKMCELGKDVECPMANCAKAMKMPNWLDENGDTHMSMSCEASVALAAIGSDTLPMIIGLLYDDDPIVRLRAAESLWYLTWNGVAVDVLPSSELRHCIPAVKDVLSREHDPNVRSKLVDFLNKFEE